MPRRSNAPRPSDEEIMKYDNVPIPLAASYLGTSSPTMMRALQQGRTPFGWAAFNEETGTYTYNVSPGGLVEYKHRGYKAVDLTLMEQLMQEAVDRLVAARMDKLKAAMRLMEQ